MCKECGQELYDFHQFYKRIENAQQNYASTFKTELETSAFDYKDNLSNDSSSSEDCKDDVFEEKMLIENYMEPDIVMEQPLSTEFMVDTVKTEMEDDISNEPTPLKQKRKRGRPPKDTNEDYNELNEDPLKKTAEPKECKLKTAKKKKCIKKENNTEDKISQDEQNHNTQDNQDDSETDSDYQDEKQTDNIKKKNHRNLDENTLKEYDRIIAEFFKIFCNICQKELDNFISLRRHFKVEHKQRGYARCCKRNFFTRSLLVDHIHVHQNPEHFKCLECGKVFSDRSRLQCHRKLHDDDSKLDKCEQCGKLFADKGALKKHVLTHRSEKLFPCSICGKQ